MDKHTNNNFTIACDMDDVLMVPHTYIGFSKYLGISDEISIPLKEYKSGKRSYESLWKQWHNIVSMLSPDKRAESVKYVADSISGKTYEFVEKSKKLGRFIIVSNNDGGLVKAIAEKLKVEYIAVNKYIFEFVLITQRKSEAVKKRGVVINAAVTDDPVNEKDFLDLPQQKGCGIVFCRKGAPDGSYDSLKEEYRVVNSLDETYERLCEIKDKYVKEFE
jgi:hypothetical protein